MSFFRQLNFSSSNEDGATELRALAACPPRRLLCLTGSGSRVLDMTLGQPAELIAIDLNPVQNHLLRLKIAAYRTLNDDELPAYLGMEPHPDRLRLHARVATALEPEARAFWDQRSRQIARGLWYAGLWEKVLRFGAGLTGLVRRGAVDRLFAAASLDEQAAIWARDFDDALWRGSIRLLGRKFVWSRIVGEPGGDFLPSPDEVERRLAGAFTRAAASFFFHESEFASLVLRGRHAFPQAVPLHLRRENLARVRDGLDRIRIVEGGLADLGRLGIADVDAFSLSDFGSYCDRRAHEICWRAVAAAAAPGARVCERIFMNALPFADGVAWDHDLSRELTLGDRAFIYEIRAGAFR